MKLSAIHMQVTQTSELLTCACNSWVKAGVSHPTLS